MPPLADCSPKTTKTRRHTVRDILDKISHTCCCRLRKRRRKSRNWPARVIPATSEGSLFAIRNGAAARFDATTFALTAVRDLLPAVPDIPKDGASPITCTIRSPPIVSCAWRSRWSSPRARPACGDRQLLCPARGRHFEREGTPGARHSSVAPSMSAKANSPTIARSQPVYPLQQKAAADLTAGTPAKEEALPELMLEKIYPARN